MKIAIVGGGLVGRLFAWHLCQKAEVHVFEQSGKDKNKTCGFAAGAMISPYSELAVLGYEWLEKALAALRWWPVILKSLPHAVYYQQSGTVVIASLEHASLLNQWLALLKRQLPSFSPSIIRGKQFSCYIEDEAHINPRQLLPTLAEYVINQGVCWHEKTVQAIKPYELLIVDETHHFDWIIDCRGLGAKTSIPSLRGVRGEMILLEAPKVLLAHAVRFLHPLYGCYIVPQGENSYMIGATHMESESAAPMYVKSAMSLLTGALLCEPQFKDAHLLESKVGLRPTTSNHLPFVDKVPGLLAVNGLFRHGFLLAPAIVAELVDGIIKERRCE